MTRTAKIKAIQKLLGVAQDGHWGPKSAVALAELIQWKASSGPTPDEPGWHHGLASSFADPADIEAFRRCKKEGKSDQECFRVGDNGMGKWGDWTAEGTGPACALPPEDWEPFGEKARRKGVFVRANGKTLYCLLKDTMPRKENIRNGAVIDLSPDAAKALGLEPPFLVGASWRWA